MAAALPRAARRRRGRLTRRRDDRGARGRSSSGSGPVRSGWPTLAPEAAAARGGRAPDGWSEREIVAHLVRVDREVFQVRLRDLTGAVRAAVVVGRTGRGAWARDAGHPRRRFATVRAATIAHLAGLDDAGWARSGVHATYGRLDVAALLGIAIDHDADHIAELERRAG